MHRPLEHVLYAYHVLGLHVLGSYVQHEVRLAVGSVGAVWALERPLVGVDEEVALEVVQFPEGGSLAHRAREYPAEGVVTGAQAHTTTAL